MKAFKKSSYCSEGKCCVEVAIDEDVISIRNSKNPNKIIQYSSQEWKDFIEGVRNNEFNINS